MCIYTYVYTHMCIYTHIYIYIYTYTYIHIGTYIHTCVCVYIHIPACSLHQTWHQRAGGFQSWRLLQSVNRSLLYFCISHFTHIQLSFQKYGVPKRQWVSLIDFLCRFLFQVSFHTNTSLSTQTPLFPHKHLSFHTNTSLSTRLACLSDSEFFCQVCFVILFWHIDMP